VFTHLIFWLWFAGLTFLIAGLVTIRKKFLSARGLDRLIVLGPVFVAAPLATFGAEHFVDARAIMQFVPAWMPAHLFWTYFVGCGLFAAAISLVAMNSYACIDPAGRDVFSVRADDGLAVRGYLIGESGLAGPSPCERQPFAGGAWALAGSLSAESKTGNRKGMAANEMILFGRFSLAFAAIWFGIEQLLHPGARSRSSRFQIDSGLGFHCTHSGDIP